MTKVILLFVTLLVTVSCFSQNCTKFLLAVEKGNIDEIKSITEKGIDINCSNEKGNTALILAVKSGNVEIADFILEKDCDVNAKNVMQYNALLYAVDACDFNLVKKLIEHGAEVEVSTHTGATALMHAVETGNIEIVQYLIHKGAQVNAWERINGETALMWALINKEEAIAKLLIEKGAQVNANQILGYTPLIIACKYNLLESVKLLINKGADPLITDKKGDNCLDHVPYSTNLSVIKYLIGYEGNNPHTIGLEGYNGFVVIKHASMTADLELLRFVFQHRKSKEIDYTTSFLLAAQYGHKNIIIYLIEELNTDINSCNASGETALYVAAVNGKKEIVEYLLSNGAEKDKVQSEGKTPLIGAVIAHQTDIVRILVEMGAGINISDRLSNEGITGTPLIHASAKGFDDIVKILIASNANVNFRNEEGQDALQMALNFNHYEIAEFLIKNGANPNSKNKKGFTVLMLAASKGNLKLVKLLVEGGANINSFNKEKALTAIDLAVTGKDISDKLKDKIASENFKEVIAYLKSKGAKTGNEVIKNK